MKGKHVDLWLIALGATLVIGALRLYLIARLGSSYPFWDQWDAEINGIYHKYLSGTLSTKDFFLPHNEHRIFFTRVIALALFLANQGQFDARIQLYVNLGLFSLSALLLARYLLTSVPGPLRPTFLIFFIIACAVPLSWENTLAGFQNQFYLLQLWAIIALWLAAYRPQARWFVTLLLAGCTASLFTMASGVLLPFFVAVVLVARSSAPFSRPTQLIPVGLLIMLFVIGIISMPHVARHDALRAQSAHEYYVALRSALSWPFRGRAILALLLPAPTLIGAVQLLRDRYRGEQLDPHLLYPVSLGAWGLAQCAAIAYSRGHDPIVNSRYMDLLTVGLAANTALALRLLMPKKHSGSLYRRALPLLHPLLLILGLLAQTPSAISAAIERHTASEAQLPILSKYLRTQDPVVLLDAKDLFAYPQAERLVEYLRDPLIVSMMPADIAAPVTARWEHCQGVTTPGLAPGTPPPPGSQASIGSFLVQSGERNQADCSSSKFSSKRAFLLTYIMKNPNDEALDLRLVGDGDSQSPHAVAVPGTLWTANILRAYASSQLLITDHSHSGWIAATTPVEIGPLSAAIYSTQQFFWIISAFSLVGGMMLILLFLNTVHPNKEIAE